MKPSDEILLRQGSEATAARIAQGLSTSELHAEIAACERPGQLPAWHGRFYNELLVERYLRPWVDESHELDYLDDEDEAALPESVHCKRAAVRVPTAA